MEKLLKAILDHWHTVENIKTNILNSFHTLNAVEIVEHHRRLTSSIETLKKLQTVAFDIFEPINMTTIVRDGKYQYGESHYQHVEITAEQAFGKPYCSAEEWYKNQKLQALYPNKYTK